MRDTSRAEAAIEQDLREQSAERMAEEHRLLGQSAANDAFVVVDDFRDADSGQRGRWISPQIRQRHIFVRPRRRLDIVAARLETALELVPRQRRQPGAMNEDDGLPIFRTLRLEEHRSGPASSVCTQCKSGTTPRLRLENRTAEGTENHASSRWRPSAPCRDPFAGRVSGRVVHVDASAETRPRPASADSREEDPYPWPCAGDRRGGAVRICHRYRRSGRNAFRARGQPQAVRQDPQPDHRDRRTIPRRSIGSRATCRRSATRAVRSSSIRGTYPTRAARRSTASPGQETAGGSEADPWVGVGVGQIDAAARETIDKLADWVRG